MKKNQENKKGLKQRLIERRSFIYQKINNKIGYLKSKWTLFKNAFSLTTRKELNEWKLDDDKTVKTLVLEWTLNTIAEYGFAGLAISYSLHTIVGTPFAFSWIVSTGIAYWFLKKLLLMIRTGKDKQW